jgi:CHASE2 domain-containing sensor protein
MGNCFATFGRPSDRSGTPFPWCDTGNVQALALWAFAGLLPTHQGEDGNDPARSLRRRFALVGLLLGSGLAAFLWDWTANLAVVGAASVVMVAALWLYSEQGRRSEA